MADKTEELHAAAATVAMAFGSDAVAILTLDETGCDVAIHASARPTPQLLASLGAALRKLGDSLQSGEVGFSEPEHN
jgi:hypothetical protein